MNEPKRQAATKLSVVPTPLTADLLNQKHLCKDIARAHASIEKVFSRLQLDLVTEENRDSVGPTILALKHIYDHLFVFKTKGDLYIEQEEKEK